MSLIKNTGSGSYQLDYYTLTNVVFDYTPTDGPPDVGAIQATVTFVDQPTPLLVQTGIVCNPTAWSSIKAANGNAVSKRISGFLVNWQLDVMQTIRHLVRVGVTPTADMLNKLVLDLNLCYES